MVNKTSHTERTASQPRQSGLHSARLAGIKLVNPRIRLLKLALPYAIEFLPGQWLDFHIPGLPKAGGFTITSTPSASAASLDPHLELAIQESPSNPPASWLWRQQTEILESELKVRVGGNFVWPPPDVDVGRISRLVLVAGGVGINPLISILSHLHETSSLPRTVKFLYATKLAGKSLDDILFFPRLRRIFDFIATADISGASRTGGQGICGETGNDSAHQLDLYLSGDVLDDMNATKSGNGASIHYHRVTPAEVVEALGREQDREGTVAYVCGPQEMTDRFVSVLQDAPGMGGKGGSRVLCEKWW